MKRIFYSIFLTANLLAFAGISSVPLHKISSARAQSNNDLYYTFQGQRIPLSQHQDVIGVAFKPGITTRASGSEPPYLQLQQDLQGGTRNPSPTVEVNPLGENYAIVSLPSGVRGGGIQQKIQQQPYVQATLPVLTTSGNQELIVLPNEIVISFDSGISESQKQKVLKENNLEIVRPLRYNRNFYIVKSTRASGITVLNVANQLNQVKGINSAVPNFIQSVSKPSSKQSIQGLNTQVINKQNKDVFPTTDYLGLQWHLNSTPIQQCLKQKISSFKLLQSCLKTETGTTTKKFSLPRTDLRVTDAWKHSNGGRDVVVAVIDSLIQWDHPDLQNSLYTVSAPDKCPGEVHGWDFSKPSNSSEPCEIGDPDTRMSLLELAILKRKFQDTFKLSDAALLGRYPKLAREVKRAKANLSQKEQADLVRYIIRTYEVGSEFHGTWVSGVIAAKPQGSQGVVGVAPHAKILPVRVFGLNGSIFTSSYIEAIGYAANRGADVINLSLGASLPTDVEQQAINQVLEENPKLVIVASSGNENATQVAYPSGYAGVLSVGATNLLGKRAPYSNYGNGLGVVAPGGDLETPGLVGGIATTGGTWLSGFWQGISDANFRWSNVIDLRGKYWWVEGTSFSSPAVAGVVALMKGEDTNRKLNRQELISILKSTASYDGLTISKKEQQLYCSRVDKGAVPNSVTDKQYFFGHGLVNADAAVSAVQK